MANFTPNFNLKKPLGAEFFNVEDQNGNMDIIDGKMKDLSSADGVGIPEVIATALGLQPTASVAEGLNSLVGRSKIATGSYNGTGAYGETNKNTLTFPFVPKVVFVSENPTSDQHIVKGGLPWFCGNSLGQIILATGSLSSSYYNVSLEWTQNTLSWYSVTDSGQLNNAGQTYSYLALG